MAGPVQILTLTAATTPALTQTYATSNAAPGFPYGQPRSSLIYVQTTGKSSTSVTSVKFKILGSMTGASGTWVALRGVRAGDSTGAVGTEHSVACTSSTTTYDAIATEETRDWLFIDVQAKSVGADASTGDSCAAYVWVP